VSSSNAVALAIGVKPVNTQVQHSIYNIDLQETLFTSSFKSL